MENLDENIVDEFYINIGKNVKRLREEKGLTQLQLSQALGFKSVGLVSQSELYLKKQHFNLKHLYLISLVLECNMNEFFK
ncbi:MAG: helix-turn-helix domain-containing protein [Arcobacteraceae bacterium]|nr:helix-turn-helix domain-containing protein [Arcobacteraceae bacterium]